MGRKRADPFPPMPPKPGDDSADEIGDDVPRIAGDPAHDVRADDLEQDGPDDEVQENFTGSGQQIMLTQTKPALGQQQRGQRARNQQDVVKIAVDEGVVNVGLEAPAVDGVKQAPEEKKTVAQIPKRFQSSARMTRPNERDSRIFRIKIIYVLTIIDWADAAMNLNPACMED